MNFEFTEEQEMLRQTVQRFCEKDLNREYCRWLDENVNFVPKNLWNKFADIGFLGMSIPKEYDGLGLGVTENIIVMEELATASMGAALCLGTTLGFGATPITHMGTDEQKRDHLPQIAAGKQVWALALTEPAGGTDILGAIKTKAVDDGDHWVINGQKVFISSAHAADYILTVAITNPDAKRSHGLSCFIVPQSSEGLELRLIPKLGNHVCGINEIFYEDVRVPKKNILGTLHEGWYELLLTLNTERIWVSAASLGVAKAAFMDAMEYAKQREAFGGPIARFQIIQHYLGEMAIEIENARNLIYKCAWLADQGRPIHIEACMAKIMASRASEKAAILGMEILGGYGYTMEYDMQRYFRDYKQGVFSPITDEMAMNMMMKFMGLPQSW